MLNSNITIINQLRIGFGLLIVLIVGMGVVGSWSTSHISYHLEHIMHEYATAERSERLRADINQMRRFEKDMFLHINSEATFGEYKQKHDEAREHFSNTFKVLSKLANDQYEEQTVSEIGKNDVIYINGFNNILNKINRREITDSTEANRQIEQYKPASLRSDKLADEMARKNIKTAEETAYQNNLIRKNVNLVMIVMGCLSLVVAFFVSITLSRSITNTHEAVKEQRDLVVRQKLELEALLAKVKLLEGIIPICSYCKKIRDDKQSWHMLESYISNHSEAMFSHGVCPECFEEQMKLMKETKDYTQAQNAQKVSS